jgi:glutathione peroxidase-family protein
VFLKQDLSGGVLGQALKWNFSKFLCDSEGVPVKRYGPKQSPLSFEADIQAMLEGGGAEADTPPPPPSK